MQDITLDPDGCAFNVRAFLLSLQDFKLHNVEVCTILLCFGRGDSWREAAAGPAGSSA